jgi:polyisoprenoid-binding protein YceI
MSKATNISRVMGWKRVGLVGVSMLAMAAGLVVVATGPGTTPVVAAQPAKGGAFGVDVVHSSVVFGVKWRDVANFYGTFKGISGSLEMNPADMAKSMVDVSIDPASVDSRNSGRDDHLKGPDFFSVKEFPAITFKSTKVTKTGEKTFDLEGNLTFRGVTKPITAKGTFTGEAPSRGGGTNQGFEATFSFKRSDFGNNYMVGKGLSDEITIIASLVGERK